MVAAERNRVFLRVYELLTGTLLDLATGHDRTSGMRAALEDLGLGDRARASPSALVDGVLAGVRPALESGGVPGLRRQGSSDPRHDFVLDYFLGLGVHESTARNYARGLIEAYDGTRPEIAGARSLELRLLDCRHLITTWRPVIMARGRVTYRALYGIIEDASVPYRGTEADPAPGIEQTVELLQRFPDLATGILGALGMRELTGFPPQGRPAPGSDAAIFQSAVQAHLDAQWWGELLYMAGLTVAAVAVTLLSAGTLGPAAAAVLGAGIGTVQGGLLVLDRASAVAEGRVAVEIGAMESSTLRQLEQQLQGAWGMAVVNLATMGLLGRFGGTTLLGSAVRGTAISGAGGGVSAALDPRVWDSPNTLALILEATALNAVAGLAGAGVAAGVSRAIPTGAPMQLALTRGQTLRAGERVQVSIGRDDPPLQGIIAFVDERAGTVAVTFGENQRVTLRVRQVVAITDGPPAPQLGGANAQLGVNTQLNRPPTHTTRVDGRMVHAPYAGVGDGTFFSVSRVGDRVLKTLSSPWLYDRATPQQLDAVVPTMLAQYRRLRQDPMLRDFIAEATPGPDTRSYYQRFVPGQSGDDLRGSLPPDVQQLVQRLEERAARVLGWPLRGDVNLPHGLVGWLDFNPGNVIISNRGGIQTVTIVDPIVVGPPRR